MSLQSNQLFNETNDIMKNFYDGKLGGNEVKNISRNISIIQAEKLLQQTDWQDCMNISAEPIRDAPVCRMKKKEKSCWKAKDLAGEALIIIMRIGIGHVRTCRRCFGRPQMSLRTNMV